MLKTYEAGVNKTGYWSEISPVAIPLRLPVAAKPLKTRVIARIIGTR
jgi:hypothetical protein